MLYLPSTFVMVPTFVAPLTATDTPGNGSSLPACTNYCVYKTTNLEPLSQIVRSVKMSQVLDGVVYYPDSPMPTY